MRKFIVIIFILFSCASVAQQPFYSDRKFISYDGVDTLYLNFTGDNIEWLFTKPIKIGDNLIWNDTTLSIVYGTANTFVGFGSAESITTGNTNSFFGYQSGRFTTIGSFNTYIGYRSGYLSISGQSNLFCGYEAGESNLGSSNVFLGRNAGKSSSSGSNNVYIGRRSGETNTGSDNIFMGYQSGLNESGSNKLIIENSNDIVTPLIHGDFAADTMKFNAKTSSNYYIGDLYIDGDSVTAITSGVTKTIQNWNDGGESISENTTLTDSSITIASDGNGYYNVGWDLSFTFSTNNTLCHAYIVINDVQLSKSQAHRRIATGGDIGDAGKSNVKVWLNDSDEVKFIVGCDKTGNLTIHHGYFSVERIN